MKYTVRPLTDRTWIGQHAHRRSQFTSGWSETLNLLEREVYAIQRPTMDAPILMVDASESEFRIDGQLRSRAKLSTPAVALSFDSVRGPLIFRCDRYDDTPHRNRMELWQHNIRAIALTLEALRAVDRHGATQSGEQYTGYRQIEAKSTTLDETPEHARAVLRGLFPSVPLIATDQELVRYARRSAHPDTAHGSRGLWDEVQRAALALGVS